ncbi:MAG: AAA family ATPase [bacterium]
MEQITINKMQQEAFEHLLKGRARLALPLAEQLIQERSNESEAAICYAWALLENGDPINAEKFMKLSAELPGDSISSRMYRAYLQMRLSSFEGAIYDFNMTEGKQKELLAWTYLNKAKALAAIGETERAFSFYNLAIMIDNNANPDWKKLKIFFQKAKDIGAKKIKDNVELIHLCQTALRQKEYWFAILASKTLTAEPSIVAAYPDVEIIELESMYKLNQFQPVLEKIEILKKKYPYDDRIKSIELAVINSQKKGLENKIIVNKGKVNSGTNKPMTEFFPCNNADVFSMKLFDVAKEEKNKVFYSSINLWEISEIGVEIIFNNPFYQKKEQTLNCFLAWYIEDDLIDQLSFNLTVPIDWDAIVVNRSIDTKKNRLWRNGETRVELFVAREMAARKIFTVGSRSIIEVEEKKDKSVSQSDNKNEEQVFDINQVMGELNSIIGLDSIKKSVKELIDYLEFIRERKQLGLKAKDQIAVHSVFLGNPGTGKTTVARLMGKIFKGMGLLSKGEVIEVDRSTLVGQYVGETAQKTEKLIEEALGNVLFIDEAYALVKKGSSNDFGQEAIDILLKRMEDKKGEFFVIVAGYPKEMQDFLDANPGLRSRFTHNFLFEDYKPEELLEIFNKLVKEEDYRIADDAQKALSKELINLYRGRDKNFGNARTVRKIFEDAKIEISKRYLTLAKHERTQEKLTTIYLQDIQNIIQPKNEKKEVKLPINEELLKEVLDQIDKLQGLNSVKKDIREMIKLAKYFNEIGENIKDKFSSHILFLGSPGTGKTTVARIICKIYSALAILPQGQLIETDRTGLVSNHVGETAIKTKAVIDSSMGGTLFIDEAYALVKGGENDFGKESIDTLLKRMEDDRGKFIVVAAGYTDEMKAFLESNPGMKSRFTKTFFFEDYTPDDLLQIFTNLCKKESLKIDEESKNILSKYFNSIYRDRDKNFGNARIVRNVFDSANRQRILRLADTSKSELNDEKKFLFLAEDFEEIKPKDKKINKIVVVGDKDKLEDYLKELNDLVGLDSVKEGVTKLVSSLKIAQLRRERGLEVMQKSLHSVFTGNPGTGKTTVARILANIYKELGVVEKGQLIEVDRAQLVAGYTGQTAIKTDEIITKALGGILFIDEAYTLSRGGGDFGQEAIDTLLKRMEDYKGQFVVIVAGYTKEMQTFIDSNPGLYSRFANTFTFEDYLPEQLSFIAEGMAKAGNYSFDEGGKRALIYKFNEIYTKRDKNFGNARTAKNTLMQIISNQEDRIINIFNPSIDALQTIVADDVLK